MEGKGTESQAQMDHYSPGQSVRVDRRANASLRSSTLMSPDWLDCSDRVEYEHAVCVLPHLVPLSPPFPILCLLLILAKWGTADIQCLSFVCHALETAHVRSHTGWLLPEPTLEPARLSEKNIKFPPSQVGEGFGSSRVKWCALTCVWNDWLIPTCISESAFPNWNVAAEFTDRCCCVKQN